MAGERPRTPSPTCGDSNEPDESDAVEAVEIKPLPGRGGAAYDTAEGTREVFHAYCFPERDPRYRRL